MLSKKKPEGPSSFPKERRLLRRWRFGKAPKARHMPRGREKSAHFCAALLSARDFAVCPPLPAHAPFSCKFGVWPNAIEAFCSIILRNQPAAHNFYKRACYTCEKVGGLRENPSQ
jgi:hypothetical protein